MAAQLIAWARMGAMAAMFVVVAVGCGGSPQRGDGSAGATGAAGTTGGAAGTGPAGTTGAAGGGGGGGTSGGSGGSAGSSGAGGGAGMTDAGNDADAWIANGCQTSVSPAGALISDFETVDGGAPVIAIGALMPFGSDVRATVVTGGLRLEGSAHWDLKPQGATITFRSCVDARAYDGVSFSIETYAGGYNAVFFCLSQFSIVDTAHAPTGGMFGNATGSPDAVPPAYIFLEDSYFPGGDGSTRMTVRVPFSRLSDDGASPKQNPTTPTDPAKLIGIQWGFTATNLTNTGKFDVLIDDVMFYSDGDGGSDAPIDTPGGN